MRPLRLTWGFAVLCTAGLAGCPTVDLGDTPEDPPLCNPDRIYFEDVIWPEYLAPADPDRSCVGRTGCHRITDGRSALRLDTEEPIDVSANYQVVRRFLNCGSPASSSLLTKPLGGLDPHAGGDLFADTTDPAVVAFEAWFP